MLTLIGLNIGSHTLRYINLLINKEIDDEFNNMINKYNNTNNDDLKYLYSKLTLMVKGAVRLIIFSPFQRSVIFSFSSFKI